MSEAMFSGHGIRTLSSQEVAYNPLSYHNGSIWPHDNSIIMEGFRLYGYSQELEKLALALIGVLESSDDFRLPELYCGFRKRGTEPPVPYDVACKPQAWAAGSVFLMLKSLLGISMDLDQSYLVFNFPLLTPKVNFMEIKNFRARDFELDLIVRRAGRGTYVEVTRKSGALRVLTVK
jgi:glycogen debranching enzyme